MENKQTTILVPDTASRTSEDECKWQLAPNDLFS